MRGLYPWLHFDGCSQDEWVECYRINLAALFWLGYGYGNEPVKIWDTTMPFEKPKADVVIL